MLLRMLSVDNNGEGHIANTSSDSIVDIQLPHPLPAQNDTCGTIISRGATPGLVAKDDAVLSVVEETAVGDDQATR